MLPTFSADARAALREAGQPGRAERSIIDLKI